MASDGVEKQSMDDLLEKSSNHTRNQLMAFMLFTIYALVSVGGTSDRQLLLVDTSPFKLPFLGIELPLIAFFAVAPVILVIFHLYVLFNLSRHRETLELWKEKNEGKEVYPFFFNYLAEYEYQDISHKIIRFAMWFMAYFLPIMVLILTQWIFSAYHDAWLTSWHFILVLGDGALLMMYWPRILYREELSDNSKDTKVKEERPINLYETVSSSPRKTTQKKAAFIQLIREMERIQGILQTHWDHGLFIPIRYILLGLRRLWKIFLIVFHGEEHLGHFIILPLKKAGKLFTLIKKEPKTILRPLKGTDTMIFWIILLYSMYNCVAINVMVRNLWQDYFYENRTSKILVPHLELQGQTLIAKKPSDTMIQKYLEGIKGTKEIKKAREEAELEFTKGLNLRSRDLRYANFYRAKMMHVDFRPKEMVKGSKETDKENMKDKYSFTYLTGANFEGADLRRSQFTRAILHKGNYSRAEFHG
ncbi:MAG: pentapeptide repeat-containing protein, partial [Spirochaetota bacterium]|nr:pentapeptide repeat-containing protein [Spirochaetota bacterium]